MIKPHMKILILDIETAPNVVHVWGLWKQNVAISQIVSSSYTLCWAAKWLGKSKMYFQSVYDTTPEKMIQEIWELVDEADVVMHFNGTAFDMPTLNNEFLKHGMKPPSPYKQIDILLTARKRFRFTSNKLEYVVRLLGVGKKVPHYGHKLWVACMAGKDKAWKIMEKYNKQDVKLLESVYYKLLPWITGHPNQGLFKADRVCVNCGSKHIHQRGFTYTNVFKYPRYRCMDCGKWMRGRKAVLTEDNKGVLLSIAE